MLIYHCFSDRKPNKAQPQQRSPPRSPLNKLQNFSLGVNGHDSSFVLPDGEAVGCQNPILTAIFAEVTTIMSPGCHRGPNVAMERHLMRPESRITFTLLPEAFYLSRIAMHAHPNAAEIAPHPRSRLACVANVTSSITTPIVNHAETNLQ